MKELPRIFSENPNQKPVVYDYKGEPSIVIMSISDYSGMLELINLLGGKDAMESVLEKIETEDNGENDTVS